jgi:hypothetical protein
MRTFSLGIEVAYVADFLSGEENSCLIEEEIECMRSEDASILRIEVGDVLIEEIEGLDALGVHLMLNLIKNLVGLVSPVHAVTKTTIIQS